MGSNIRESKELAAAQAQYSRLNQVNPYGSLTYSGPPENTTATTTLSPAQQRLLQQQQLAQRLLGQQGLGMAQNLAPVTTGKQATNAFFDQALSLLNPVYEQEQRAREQQLANQGLPIGSQAYQVDADNRSRIHNETLSRLASQAVLAGQQYRLGDQQYNTSQLQNALSLLGYAQPGQPQFQQYQVPQVQSMATPGSGGVLGAIAGGLLGSATGNFGGALGSAGATGLGSLFGKLF